MGLATSESSCAPKEKCQRQVSFSLSSCRARLISAQYCVQHRTSGVHGYRPHHHFTYCYCPDAGRKIVSRWPPIQIQQCQHVQLLLSCCCTQSTTVHDAVDNPFSCTSGFHSAAAFQLNLGGLSCFTKHDNLLWSQLTNLSPPNVHFKSTIVNCNKKNRGTGMFPSQQYIHSHEHDSGSLDNQQNSSIWWLEQWHRFNLKLF